MMATLLKPVDINQSGFVPYDTRIVILPDPVEEKTKGGVWLPEQEQDKKKHAQTIATLIAVGDNAFIEWGAEAARPQPGDRIVVGRYVGNTHEGKDGRKYTVCNDEDVLAKWEG